MPMKSLTRCAAAIALVGSFAHAAPPVVTFSPSNGGSASLVERADGSYTIGIHITNISGATNVTIRPGSNNQVIYNLAVLHDQSTNDATFHIAKNGSDTFGVLRLMGWDARNTGNVYIAELRTSGNVGTVEVNSIFDLDDTSIDIGGDVTSRIRMIKAPIDLPTAQLEARIRGNLLGVIDGPDGTNWGFAIERLVVDDDIGTSSVPSNIWPRGSIKRLSVGGAIYADIDATKYVSTGDIGRIDCGGAVMAGAVKARKFDDLAGVLFAPGLFVTSTTGDLAADITLAEAMDRVIRVGRSFLSEGSINLPEDGLTGQIVFNSANNGGVWSGHVTVDTTSLTSEPYYTDEADDIGGGAAGLATFHLHDESCDPPNGGSYAVIHRDLTWIGEGDPPCVTEDFVAHLRFYGPVTLVGSSPHCIVERNDNGTWTPVSWTVETAIAPDTADREILVSRAGSSGWSVTGEYRVRPITSPSPKITSTGVTDAPGVDNFTYQVQLVDSCASEMGLMFDQDGDELLSSGDASRWATHPRDLNRDGSVTAADLAMLLRLIARFGN